ncbi:hypothetical protein [Salarchaeum sp. JOR-1]|uniref:DUF7527 domain-containing protein n=1 Tax=Salarchaeum sp. JOR-1 TaxID=2599399 RepID=UPI0011986D0F|nr:hypothetical protein [Salarchaeum sp. JOR-1]QDX41287.1 hypothetical protein FQU85_10405 [Salarchaeum sp. JOR-1]
MDSRTVERVRSWSSADAADGYRGLHALADRAFSGAVVADDTWLFMLNGRVVGVFEGGIEDFEDASSDVYEAPHLSLPLLFAMQEAGGETKATYYTNDTPLSETDETLADAGFTGYVELSENVLSGDYYTAYYGGRSLSAAFVGSSEELITGEEAFERADDEVGLYEVVTVDIDVTDVPEPDEEATGDDVEAAAGAASATEASEPTPDDGATAVAAVDETGTAGENADANQAAAEQAAADPDASSERAVKAPDEPTTDEPSVSADESERDARTTRDTLEAGDAAAVSEAEQAADVAREPPAERPSPERPEAAGVEQSPSARAVDDEGEGEDGVFSEEVEWREATTVPSLDPEKAATRPSSGASSDATQQRTQGTAATKQAAQRSQRSQRSQPARQSASSETEERVATLKEAVAEREERIEELEARADAAESEAAELRDELTDLEEERDALRNEVAELRADLETARERADAAEEPEETASSDRTPAEALAGTNLFVRYGSKADPTLDAVADGDVSAEAVNANLRLEHHTQFDASETTVDGDSFDDFLEGTAAYRFVSWIVRDLPYELLDTGRTKGLADVFDAIPDIDRAELDGTISIRDDEGEELRSTFDVVLRDRMGNPLLVAELNPERDPVTGDEMDGLVENAEVVADAQESLGGAFYVTASFFEPDALEAATDATDGGGFLSRSDKESYVKVARKSGFHLCLVEDRNETFHVTVPEL